MKKKLFAASHFLYILIFCWSVTPLKGVLCDSQNSDEKTLEIQPSILISSNTSDTEVDINPSEDNIVSTSESVATDALKQVSKIVFAEGGSELGGVANEIINNDTPVVISHIDSATEELQKRANLPLSSSSEDNLTDSVGATETNISNPVTEAQENRSDNATILETEDRQVPKNTTDNNAEDIPSFSEWAQKRLEEAEKKEQVNFSTPSPAVNTSTKQNSGAKLRWKNYASVDCGAKVILANPEAQHTWAILIGSRDEYILNPCNSRIWFVVELCEAIQLKKIDLANYELFSSSPKEFTVSVSDRFPTRDWNPVGQFTAKDERDVQSFDVNTETFGKYIRVEIKSHYGSEHYCPLSLFRAYGTSVFEVLQKDDPAHEQPIDDDDDDDDETLDHSPKDSGNLLSTATDAVLSMVKKAAQVLGNKVNKTNDSSQICNDTKSDTPIIKSCSSPSHYVVCNNCSDLLFGQIFELLSCRRKQIRNLVSIPFISKSLKNSMVCQTYGFDFTDKSARTTVKSGHASVESFFPPSYLGAMCNSLAVSHNKVLYNISHQYANTTENIPPGDNIVDVKNSEPKIKPAIKELPNISENHESTEPLNVDYPDVIVKASCSTDPSYTSQVKPTNSFATELPLHPEAKTASPSIDQVPLNSDNIEQGSDLPQKEATVVESSTEFSAEPPELSTDGNGEENVDKLITEMNTEATPSMLNAPVVAPNLQGQKESVFLRLSNRIKALERNMSLSSQYLEELSKRYKKQVEEMQRVLEKTEQTLNEVTSKEEERFRQLEKRLESLTNAMENLLADRNGWKATSCWLFCVLLTTFLVYCFKRYSTSKPPEAAAAKPVEIQRRNSVDVVNRVTPKKKKRRPSDQALKIVASAASGDQDKQPRKRKKKSSNPSDHHNNSEDKFAPPCTSSKIWSKTPSNDWVEGRTTAVEDIPIALEEPDSDWTIGEAPLAEDMSTINAPAYVRTATNFRLGRTSTRLNGKVSLDEIKKRKPSPAISVNGSISSSNGQATPRKEKKGFMKIWKKVF